MNKIILTFLLLYSIVFPKLSIIDTHKSWEQYPSATPEEKSMKDPELNLKKLLEYNNNTITELLKEKTLYLSEMAKIILKTNNTHSGYCEVGILYAQNYFYKDALNYFFKGLKKKSDWNIYNNIANIYFMTREDKLAIKYYGLALKMKRDNPIILLNLSFIYYDKGNFKKAKLYYLKAVIIDPALDREEYRVISGDNKDVGSKANNKGVKQLELKWSK